LLRALSNLVLNVSRDGTSTTSLGNPFQLSHIDLQLLSSGTLKK